MKKKLVRVDNLEEFICRSAAVLYADGTLILTAGAKDELGRRGISVVRGPCPEAAAGRCTAHAPGAPATGQGNGASGENAEYERLLFGVAAILKSEYGITDPETLRALSLQTVRVIRANIG